MSTEPTLTERAIAAQLVDECTRGESVHVGDLAGHLADFLAAQRVAIHARYEAVAKSIAQMPVPGGYDGDPWDNGWDAARAVAAERIRQVAAQ